MNKSMYDADEYITEMINILGWKEITVNRRTSIKQDKWIIRTRAMTENQNVVVIIASSMSSNITVTPLVVGQGPEYTISID